MRRCLAPGQNPRPSLVGDYPRTDHTLPNSLEWTPRDLVVETLHHRHLSLQQELRCWPYPPLQTCLDLSKFGTKASGKGARRVVPEARAIEIVSMSPLPGPRVKSP